MRTERWKRGAWFAAALFVAGCGAAGGETATGERSGPRSIATVAWDTVFQIGGAVEDTVLFQPRILAARNRRLYAFDYHDSRVKAFDDQGRLRWAIGRAGGGPGEFQNPTHLAVAPNGDVWVTDPAASRLTVIDPDGRGMRHVPLDGRTVMRTLPGDEELIGLLTAPEDLWVALNTDGALTDRGPLPTDQLRAANPPARTLFAAQSPSGSTWATVFALGDPLLVYRGRELQCTGSLVEGGDFPAAPHRGMLIWAVAVAVSDSLVSVLPRGRTGDALQLLDEYSAEDCRYRRSVRLPRTLQAMTFDGDIFYFYFEDPAPTILALRRLPN